MSKINKINMRQILNNVEIILKNNDIIYFCDDMNVIKEFLEMFSKGAESLKDLKQFLIDNEEHIDKEKLILLTVKNYKDHLKQLDEQIEKLSNQFSRDSSKETLAELVKLQHQSKRRKVNLDKAIRLGQGVETVVSVYYYDEKEKLYKIEVIDSSEVIQGKKVSNTKALKRFDEIDSYFKEEKYDEQLGMEYVLQSLYLTDLYNIFVTEQFGVDVRTLILENEILKNGKKTKQELDHLRTFETYEEYAELLENIDFRDMLPEIKGVLREYAQYIDFDKLLLISAYRFNDGLEKEDIAKEDSIGAKDILRGILNNIKDKNAQIPCELQIKKDNEYVQEQIIYSTKDIKKCISQFTSSEYLTSKEIQEYRERINNGEINLSNIPNRYIDKLFSVEELEDISTLSVENLICVFQIHRWNESKLIDLYQDGQIPIDYIKHIKHIIDLSASINFKTLNTYYTQTKQKPEDEDIKIKYEKYLKIYKEIIINEKDEEEIEQNSKVTIEKIVENFDREEFEAAIKNYYKEGIITVDSILEWSDKKLITDMFYEGLITLENMHQLVEENKIPVEYLNDIYGNLINNSDMEYNERLKLLKNGYAKEQDILDLYKRNLLFEKDLRQLAEDGIIREKEMQKLIESRTMEELERNSSIRLTGLNSLTKKNSDVYSYGSYITGTENNMQSTGKLIIDPNERERFIKLLKAYKADTDLMPDSPFYNYEFYVIPDETKKIGLNSVVIAERYYEDKDTESRFATNNATYFFKYKDLMVLSNLRKSEMTKERQNIVFTANHVIANEKRQGRWATDVIASLVKTMLSCDLKEYTKENQKIIILQKLKDVYEPKEIMEILNLAEKIDRGEYICEIEEEAKNISKRKNRSSNKRKNPRAWHEDEGR